MELRREDWPWIYERGDKPALIISSIESLAILIALKLFYGSNGCEEGGKVMVAPTWTDNRRNGSLLNKLMTTKFPGCALLMELACLMKKRSMKVLVDWTPREGNKADQLANGVVKNFSPELEIKLDPSLIQWEILPDALRMAASKAGTRGRERRDPMRGCGYETPGDGTLCSPHSSTFTFRVSFRIIHYSFGAVLLYGLLTRFCRQLRLTVLVCVIRVYSGWAAFDSCTSVALPRTCLTCPSLVVSTWDLFSAPCCGSSATAAYEGWYAPYASFDSYISSGSLDGQPEGR